MDSSKKKTAWMTLQEYQMPHIKNMELGKKYTFQVEMEPTELSTGENEWNNGKTVEYSGGIGGKPKESKAPMTGKFKVHSISMVKMSKTKKGKAERY